jgi:methionyl-tRNA formyltransferase
MNKSDLKIVFFGTPDFAVPALKLLIESGYSISAVFTGRGPVGALAQEHQIKVFQPVSLKKDEQVFEEFKNLKPDICIVAAYGKILPQKFLDVPRYGFLNIHPSLLPKYRGPSPIQTAILNRDKETGVAIMVVDAEVDHGPILKEITYNMQSSTHYKEAEKDLAEIGAKLMAESIPGYISGEIKPKEQNHSQATLTKMFQREAGRINWDQPCEKIYDQIRALGTEPGTWTTWKGKVLNIFKVEILNKEESSSSGLVTTIDGNVAVATKKCYLILKSIQLEGGKEMDAKSFVNGHPDFLNSTLE